MTKLSNSRGVRTTAIHAGETPDPETAYGARGVGEIGLVPTAPAVAAALEAFDGVHRKDLPMSDAPAAQAILKPKRKSAE